MLHIKKIYLYLVSVIALVIWVVGGIMLVNMALKTWVFPKADHYTYYGMTKLDCERTKAGQAPGTPLPAECTDPDYEERQRKMEQENRTAQKQRDAAQALAMILIAAPVWYFHWKLAKRES